MNISLSILRGEANAVSSSLLQYQDKGSLLSFLNSSYRTTVKKNTEDNARLIYDDDDDGNDDDVNDDAVEGTTLDALSRSSDLVSISATDDALSSCEAATMQARRKSITDAMVESYSIALSDSGESNIVTCDGDDEASTVSPTQSKSISNNASNIITSTPLSFDAPAVEDSTLLSKNSKKDASWIKRLDALDSSITMVHLTEYPQDTSSVRSSPSKAAHSKSSTPKDKPKQLIPVIDRSVPLALKHSNMIDQCKKYT